MSFLPTQRDTLESLEMEKGNTSLSMPIEKNESEITMAELTEAEEAKAEDEETEIGTDDKKEVEEAFEWYLLLILYL
jgi:hypothetical protein